MKLFCKLGFHCWFTAPCGMIRYCSNCNQWEINRNCWYDPIPRWREATFIEVENYKERVKFPVY